MYFGVDLKLFWDFLYISCYYYFLMVGVGSRDNDLIHAEELDAFPVELALHSQSNLKGSQS